MNERRGDGETSSRHFLTNATKQDTNCKTCAASAVFVPTGENTGRTERSGGVVLGEFVINSIFVIFITDVKVEKNVINVT